ncbi:SDR family oxidoreductase [Paraburkholderia sp. BL6669N2]|uniref:SDR family oxidoreductase n=1 Tax=Paraburkholderia sp. BL6669N2 TaxID=1938807 RepID=UPI0015F253EC|nr:SDR family oxidoreductase [Paraburkholderia sp. BL6669N2]
MNVVSPGVVDSPVPNFLPEQARSNAFASIGAGLLVGRVSTVDELADAALFVMGNGFTTGTVLQIDGGTNA